jgi:hypothetical protein
MGGKTTSCLWECGKGSLGRVLGYDARTGIPVSFHRRIEVVLPRRWPQCSWWGRRSRRRWRRCPPETVMATSMGIRATDDASQTAEGVAEETRRSCRALRTAAILPPRAEEATKMRIGEATAESGLGFEGDSGGSR